MKIGHIPLSGEVLDGNQNLQQETTYDNNNKGNTSYKSDAGEYFYDSNRPFAIATLQNPEPALATHQQDISYTGFNQPHEIEENDFKLVYYYGPDEQRRLSILYDAQDNVIKKIYYNGNYEIIETNGNTYEVNYLFSPEGLFGIAVKENNNPVQVYYVETDHLGSILGLYNEAGQPVYTQSFDAWGRERNPETWDYTTNTGTKPEWLIRGYTGHEHLPEFTLVNMNGRMYDPVLGRMLSPDNFVQDASSTQSYNRYSYCWNNPLKYTDPSGDIVWAPIIGAVAGAYIGGSIANNTFYVTQWEANARTVAGIGIGAVAGGFGGQFIGGGSIAGKKLLANSFAGTLNSMYNYQKGQDVSVSLGYFAAGFLGSAAGLAGAESSSIAAMFVGGSFNTLAGAVEANITGDEYGGYQIAQKFMGGALSSLAGVGLYGSMTGSNAGQYLMDNKYLFGKGKMAASLNKATFYGIQSSAMDFAYTPQETYLKRTGAQHATIFGAGFVGGFINSYAKEGFPFGDRKQISRMANHFAIGLVGYGSELSIANWGRSKYFPSGWYDSKWEQKARIIGLKDVIYTLTIK